MKSQNTDIVKGYEVDHDRYVTLEPDELDALKLESRKTIDLVKFVDASDLDPRYFERPYYLGPGDKNSGEGYVVIRDALRKTGKVGLGQMTIGGTRVADRYRSPRRRSVDDNAALRRRTQGCRAVLRRSSYGKTRKGDG